jgi:hypothetical protein
MLVFIENKHSEFNTMLVFNTNKHSELDSMLVFNANKHSDLDSMLGFNANKHSKCKLFQFNTFQKGESRRQCRQTIRLWPLFVCMWTDNWLDPGLFRPDVDNIMAKICPLYKQRIQNLARSGQKLTRFARKGIRVLPVLFIVQIRTNRCLDQFRVPFSVQTSSLF